MVHSNTIQHVSWLRHARLVVCVTCSRQLGLSSLLRMSISRPLESVNSTPPAYTFRTTPSHDGPTIKATKRQYQTLFTAHRCHGLRKPSASALSLQLKHLRSAVAAAAGLTYKMGAEDVTGDVTSGHLPVLRFVVVRTTISLPTLSPVGMGPTVHSCNREKQQHMRQCTMGVCAV